VRPSSLRPEFVVSGAALLVSIGALLFAADLCLPGDARPLTDWATHPVSSGTPVLQLAGFLGVAYVLGAVVVQLTFKVHIEEQRKDWRRKWVDALRRLHTQLQLGAGNSTATGRLHSALWSPDSMLTCDDHEVALALAVIRRTGCGRGEVAREYEYRRAIDNYSLECFQRCTCSGFRYPSP
jgi:hypothetical protein